jgi:hypothetical protein
MALIVSTQSYYKDKPTEFGLLLEVDEQSGEVCRSIKIDTPVSPPGAVGRIKSGLRGIAKFRGDLYVSTWNSIVVIDAESFEIRKEISHSWMSDLHGIFVNEDGIWVTSTLPDALILYDFDAKPVRACWFSETDVYPEKKIVDKARDWRLIGKRFRGFNLFHCNHVAVSGDSIYVTGRGGHTKNGRIFTLDRSEFVSSSEDAVSPKLFVEGLFGPHDGLHHLNSIWVTETSNSSVANIDMSGRVRSRFRISDRHNDNALFGFIDSAVSSVRNSLGKPSKKLTHWTRGLSVSGSFLYVGQSTWANADVSKARIVRVDRESGRINDIFPIELSGYSEARIFQLYLT